MKRIYAAAAFMFVAVLSGCTSTKPVLGFATASYVDARLAETAGNTKNDVTELSLRVEALTVQLEQYSAKAGEMDKLLADVDSFMADYNSTKEATANLKELASKVESRLDTMPSETISAIVTVLQNYLEGR